MTYARRLHTVLFVLLITLSASSLACHANANSHPEYYFSHLKSADGLPHQQVSSMTFDNAGRLWVGTRNGLACYDGYSFTNYYHTPGDPTTLAHNFVKVLFVDSNAHLWVGTEEGLCRYIPESNSFKTYPIGRRRVETFAELNDGRILVGSGSIWIIDPSTDEIVVMAQQNEGYVISMAVAPDKRVFVATNESIYYYDEKMQSSTMMNKRIYADFLMGFDDIIPLFFDHNGDLWIGRNGKGVMRINMTTSESRIYDVPQLSNGIVRAIAEDKDHNIWLGTERGISVINRQTDKVTNFKQDFVKRYMLNDNAIYSILPDDQGNIWVGTYFGGINVARKQYDNFQWFFPGNDANSLSGKAIRQIVESDKESLWIATEDGGINILDLKSGAIERFDKIPNLGINVHTIFYDASDDEMWIGTFLLGLFRYNLKSGSSRQYLAGESGLGSNAIFSMVNQVSDTGSKLWIGSTRGLRYFDEEKQLFMPINHPVLDIDFIYCLCLDHHSNLWVGTVNNGLYCIENNSGDVIHWSSNPSAELAGLHDFYVTAIFEDKEGTLFIGTNTGGLHLLNEERQVELFSEEARHFGTICHIMQDDMSNIWVSTSNGLVRINPDDKQVSHFTVNDGLRENQFNFASSLQASDGRLYFGTVNGLVAFHPDIEKQPAGLTPVHLWRLYINNNQVTPSEEGSPIREPLDQLHTLSLEYNQSRSFSIDYGVVSPLDANTILYQVMVEGIDESWRDVGSQRRFTAMDLAPGTYKLHFRAASTPEDFDRAPTRQLVIKIGPPFYFSAWAFLIYFILLLILGYLAYRLMVMRMQEKESIRVSMVEKEKSEELNREKMEFFTNISHELKTPLSLILAPLRYISQNSGLDTESNKRLGIAITNTQKMVGIIDELVTFNRVESGNFQLFLHYDNPLTFIETVTHYFFEPAAEKQITINLYTENNGENVWFSSTYLERIINNLLTNAIKYTHEGGQIDVRARICEEENDSLFLYLSVRDNGIGIAREELENIFRKYYQTKRGYNTNHQGWGIGLATVKYLVELHKGTITVDSEMGQGSLFEMKINVTPEVFPPASYLSNGNIKMNEPTIVRTLNTLTLREYASPDNAGDKDKTSLLLVEDNSELLQFLQDSFSDYYKVFTATNGAEALKIAAEYPLDIIVSDVMMPVMDGITLCENLRNNIATSHIPVILLTAKNDVESTVKGFESGAEAYVSKPFDPQILELRIRNILRSRRQYLNEVMQATDAIPTDVTEDTPNFNNFDKEFISRINEIIDANIDNSDFAISDITKEFSISRSLLHIKMKSFFNMSMTDYIKKKRLDMACKLLTERFNVSETAYRSGYSDPNYFTKVFKKEYGMTPTEYQTSILGSSEFSAETPQ